jgi:hypothetical protein
MPQPVVHVIFTKDGLPRWFGPEPVKESVPLDLSELCPLLPADAPETALASSWQDILITHRRVDGKWMLREGVATTPENPDPAAEDAGAEGPE